MAVAYHSTRSSDHTVSAKQAILQGIAPDGGLYIQDSIGKKPLDLVKVCSQDFKSTAYDVLSTLLDDYSPEELNHCIEGAYGTQWDTKTITPVSAIGDDWLLELFHGPTSAFKDVALQILPRLMSVARKDTNAIGASGQNIMIVTATSGDTGKAALEGFKDIAGMGITVFYPEGKVSDIQRLQMVTQKGSNVAVCAVNGNFDDAQNAAKAIFANKKLAQELAVKNTVLSSANSINIGRLAPQVTYYFDAYAQLVAKGTITQGQKVTFCVPTGNFGDVLAGYFAKEMGLPVDRLIVASNNNKVLTDFLTTGTYDRRRVFEKTISPSMDILVSSNLERLLYLASGKDTELVSYLMNQLVTKGIYTVPTQVMDTIRETFDAGFATDDQTRETIRSTWEDCRVLIDPHTAVAKHVLDRVSRQANDVRVCLSTASPYKFSSDVLAALGYSTANPDDFACMHTLAEITGTNPPIQLSSLNDNVIIHTDVREKEQLASYVFEACGRIFAC
ncbi:threonine synthase [Lancefieldella parvula]|uniref:threonine synthase n=1 Tax=Lancefieldella parvula TaxID=1382 RepID=UPI00290A2F0A|nr:threonine synthase [Lancefieldella parvula]MDU4867766.1 threonine synthase [Lancefieldella parvula]